MPPHLSACAALHQKACAPKHNCCMRVLAAHLTFSVTTPLGKDPGRGVMSIRDMGSGSPSSGTGMDARYCLTNLSNSSTCSPRVHMQYTVAHLT